jgi:hypothetical protein
MSDNKINEPKNSGPFKIVGRDSRVDLSRYTVTVHGREVVDYEKLKHDDPALYEEILTAENESNILVGTE